MVTTAASSADRTRLTADSFPRARAPRRGRRAPECRTRSRTPRQAPCADRHRPRRPARGASSTDLRARCPQRRRRPGGARRSTSRTARPRRPAPQLGRALRHARRSRPCRILVDLLETPPRHDARRAPRCCTTWSRTPRSRSRTCEKHFGHEVAALVDGRDQDLGLPLRPPRGGAGRELPQDAAVDVARPARHLHQARRPAAQHAHARVPARRTRRSASRAETRDIYAPLAHRLGIGAHQARARGPGAQDARPGGLPRAGRAASQARREEREAFLERRRGAAARSASRPPGIKAEVSGRPKHFYSIYQKMRAGRGRSTRSTTCSALRIVTARRATTATARSGVVHDLFTPVPERFKDYIATPKSNLYQSLHTTVIAARRRDGRDPDPHPRDAPHGRDRRRRALRVQGGRARWTRSSTRSSAASSARPRTGSATADDEEYMDFLQHGAVPGGGLRLHAAARAEAAAQGRHAARLRVP